MAFEQIGLQAILQDAAFQDGLHRYQQGVSEMEKTTDQGANAMSMVWKGAGVAVGLGAAAVTAAIATIGAVSQKGLSELSSWNEGINELSDRLGTTGEQASAWATLFQKVGLSVEEGGMGLNFFTRGLADMNTPAKQAEVTIKDNSAAVDKLKDQLSDAEVRLSRLRETMADSKNPTKQMAWAVEDAEKKVAELNAKLASTPGTLTQIGKITEAKLSPFAEALQQLGISARNSKGQLKSFDEIMPEIMDAFKKLPKGIESSDLAMRLFGARGGTKFLDFLAEGSEGLAEATAFAKEFGLELDTKTSDAVEDFGFQTNMLSLGLRGIWVTIGKAVLPIASKFVDFIVKQLLPPLAKFAEWIAPQVAGALGWLEQKFEDVTDVLGSVYNAVRLLITGDFSGGIFGLSEDDDFIGALFDVRNVLKEVWDWIGRIVNRASKGDWSGVWSIFTSGIINAWNTVIWPTLQKWSTQFWDWLTGPQGALVQAAAKFQEFATGLGTFIAAHGPATWEQLQKWAGQFWDWLTGPDGAVWKAAERVSEFATLTASWIQTNWDTTVAPVLAEWGTKFWDWLTGKGGAIEQVVSKMGEVSTAIRTWAESTETKEMLAEAGGILGRSLAEGIKSFFTSSEGQTATDDSLRAWLESLGRSFINLRETIVSSVKTFGIQFVHDFVLAITGREQVAELAKELASWFSDAVNAFIKEGLFGIIEKLVQEFMDRLRTAFRNFGLPVSPTPGTPLFAPVPQTGPVQVPQAGGGNVGTPQFKVVIDGQEIQNALLEVTYTNLFQMVREANQLAGSQ